MGQGTNRLFCTNRVRIWDTCSERLSLVPGSRTRSRACFSVSGTDMEDAWQCWTLQAHLHPLPLSTLSKLKPELHTPATRGSYCNIHFSFWEMLLWDLLEGLCPHCYASPQPLSALRSPWVFPLVHGLRMLALMPNRHPSPRQSGDIFDANFHPVERESEPPPPWGDRRCLLRGAEHKFIFMNLFSCRCSFFLSGFHLFHASLPLSSLLPPFFPASASLSSASLLSCSPPTPLLALANGCPPTVRLRRKQI